MSLTSSEVAIAAWAATAQNAKRLWAVENTSPNYAQWLFVDVALTNEVACTGVGVKVLASSSAASDEFWQTLYDSVIFGDDTANTEASAAEWTTAATQLRVASTTGFVANGIIPIFVQDTDITLSEVAWLVGTDADPDLLIAHGLTRTHANATSTASNKCITIPIWVPVGTLRVSGFIDNTQMGAAGPTIASRIRMTKVTAVVV